MYDNDSCLGCIGAVLLVLVIVVAVTLVEAWVFMLLWNWIVGGVIGWITFSYWQSVAVLGLFNIVGGFFRTRVSSSD